MFADQRLLNGLRSFRIDFLLAAKPRRLFSRGMLPLPVGRGAGFVWSRCGMRSGRGFRGRRFFQRRLVGRTLANHGQRIGAHRRQCTGGEESSLRIFSRSTQ